MPARRRRYSNSALHELKVCPSCGGRLWLRSFPRLPGETRRSDVCGVCLRFPSTVRRDVAA